MRALRIHAVIALALALCALAAAGAGPGPAPPSSPFRYTNLLCRTLLTGGKPAEKVDMVIVGDGYLKSQLASGGKYERDCRGLVRFLFTEPPFSAYRSLFNVYAVYLESLDGGERVNGVQWPRMALGTSYLGRRGYYDIMMYQQKDRVLEAAANAPDCDIVMVMVNVSGTGGANLLRSEKKGRMIPAPCFSAEGNLAYDMAAHELGHNLGNLGDEYEDEQSWRSKPLPAQGDLPFNNLTLKGFIDPANAAAIRKTAKWGHFIDVPGASRYVSAVQGGYYRYEGVYRPSFTCKMREMRDDFCLVCQEAIVRELYHICGLSFDDAEYHRRNPVR